MTKTEFQQYMRHQVDEINAYREKLSSQYQRPVSRNEAATQWIRSFAQDFNEEYMKKMPKGRTNPFRRS